MSDIVDLGEIEPGRSRHAGRRSTVALAEEQILAGTADGVFHAFDRDSLTEQWRVDLGDEEGQQSLVSAAVTGDSVVVGERSPDGTVHSYDLTTGEERFSYDTADDIGDPQKETRFFLPFVVDIVSDEKGSYVAARRYERDGEQRSFTSVIYAFDHEGTIHWQYETDGSPISLDIEGDRLAVAFNRCPGDHQDGLIILDTATGEERLRWDPGTDGQRRVGDVSLLAEGAILASHGDYRGYRLADDGDVRWQVDLATPETIDGETLYAYPNHVHATAEGVVFVTGNTYAEESRETEGLHPHEHTVFGYSTDGDQLWTKEIGGFATGLDADGDRIAIPAAQHFRTRDPDGHGRSVVDVPEGPVDSTETAGVVTTVAIDDSLVVAIEEPVSYHDDDRTYGQYRLHADSIQ